MESRMCRLSWFLDPGKMKYSPTAAALLQPPGSRNQESRHIRLSVLKAAVLVLPQGRDSQRKHQWGRYFQAKLEEPPTTRKGSSAAFFLVGLFFPFSEHRFPHRKDLTPYGSHEWKSLVQNSQHFCLSLPKAETIEPLNIVTDSQYAERVVLHIDTAEFIPDESELTSLFIQLQDIIRNRKHPLYITHIRSHTGLPGPLVQGNDEIDKLLIGNVLEASEFHKKHHVNSKGLKRDFSITWQQAKEIVRKCPTCSFYNQTPLPAGCNPKGTQRNEIWQMDVFHFAEFGKLKYVQHTIDTCSGFQWATALSSEKADSVIMHLLEVMAIMGIPAQIKTDNAPAYVSGKMKQFFAYYNIKHITESPKDFFACKQQKENFENTAPTFRKRFHLHQVFVKYRVTIASFPGNFTLLIRHVTESPFLTDSNSSQKVKERIGLQAEQAAFTKIPKTSEIAQLLTVLTSKPDNLSSVSSIHK
ncbi:hypothetical protein STEG23_008139, partial [Scotinomys teguina]